MGNTEIHGGGGNLFLPTSVGLGGEGGTQVGLLGKTREGALDHWAVPVDRQTLEGRFHVAGWDLAGTTALCKLKIADLGDTDLAGRKRDGGSFKKSQVTLPSREEGGKVQDAWPRRLLWPGK